MIGNKRRGLGLRDSEAFQFTKDWFLDRGSKTFTMFVHPRWAGLAGLTYLEIGVFEGQSMVWMLQHVLIHPDSKAIGIDPWLEGFMHPSLDQDAFMKRAIFNTSRWSSNCSLIRANSSDVLRRMIVRNFMGITPGSVDIVLLDGAHHDFAVLDDARNSFKLLKPGGWMIFDDVEIRKPKANHVKDGLRTFKEEVGGGLKFVFKHRFMEGYEKV